MFKLIRKIYDWMESKVDSPYGEWWLNFLFFAESSFLLIPVDPLLILFCVTNRKKSYYYALVTTISSVIGGVFGYFIGVLAWKGIGLNLVTWMISEQTFYHLVERYKIYQAWAVLIAGFMPVPYKAVTISAGFCGLPMAPFIIYSCIARGGRFFLIAWTISTWGEKIKDIIDRYFNQLVVAFSMLVALSVWVLK